MNENIDIQQSNVGSIDRPSFHWHKKYLDKAHKMAEQNINRNVNEPSIYKKFPKVYNLSFLHFLPFFIGYIISFVNIFIAYGKIKSSSIFNKKLYRFFSSRMTLISFLYILFGPILCIVLILFFPLLSGAPSHIFFASLGELFSGKIILSSPDIIQKFSNFQNVIYFTFSNGKWIIGLLIVGAISMINIPSIAGYFIINVINDKTITLYVLEDNLKMKISRFANNKSKKVLKRKIINVHVPDNGSITQISNQFTQN